MLLDTGLACHGSLCWHPFGRYVTRDYRIVGTGRFDSSTRYFTVGNLPADGAGAPEVTFPGWPESVDFSGPAWSPGRVR